MVKYCSECEIEMSDFANFCPECGSRLVDIQNDDDLEETLVESSVEYKDDETDNEGDFESRESGLSVSLDTDAGGEDDVEDYENVDETPQAPASFELDDIKDVPTCTICGDDPLLKCRLCGSDICKAHGFSPEGMNMLRTKIQNALRYANVGHILYEYYPNWEGVICKTCLTKKFDHCIANTKAAYGDHTKTEGSRRKIGKALEELKFWKDKMSNK